MLFYYTRNHAALRISAHKCSKSSCSAPPKLCRCAPPFCAPEPLARKPWTFGDDQAPDARHFGALLDGELVGTGYIVTPTHRAGAISTPTASWWAVGSCAECRSPMGCAGVASGRAVLLRCIEGDARGGRAGFVVQRARFVRSNCIGARGLSGWARCLRSSGVGPHLANAVGVVSVP